MDLAPVLDVDTNPDNPVIGARSFGRDADLVAQMGSALLRGLQDEGVAACGKHFPGHGDTSQDCHYDLPALEPPAGAIAHRRAAPVRGGHRGAVSRDHDGARDLQADRRQVPRDALRARAQRPAPQAAGVRRRDHLRRDGHEGDRRPLRLRRGDRPRRKAGIDLFMLCHSHEQQYRAIEVLVKAMESGELAKERVAEAGERLDRLFAKYVKPPTRGPLPSFIGSPEHRAIAQRVDRTVRPRFPRDGARSRPSPRRSSRRARQPSSAVAPPCITSP